MKLTLAPIQSSPHSMRRAMRAACAEIASKIRESIRHVGGSHYCVCRGPIEIKAEAQDVDSCYCRHCRLRGLYQMLLYQTQNPYHWMFQLAGYRRLCQLLNSPLNASATTSLFLRLLMSIGCLALEYPKKMLKVHESIDIIYSFVSGT